jgi:hypothetical protein
MWIMVAFLLTIGVIAAMVFMGAALLFLIQLAVYMIAESLGY